MGQDIVVVTLTYQAGRDDKYHMDYMSDDADDGVNRNYIAKQTMDNLK